MSPGDFPIFSELFSKVFSVFVLLRPIISDLPWNLRNRSLSLSDFSSSANFYILSQHLISVKNFFNFLSELFEFRMDF